MSDIKSWSNSAGGNTATPPDGWPEGQAPSTVNDCAREMMSAIRRQHEDAEWIDYGYTPTMTTTSNFTMAGDRTTAFHIGRRVRCSDSSILYGTISDTTYSANTRVSLTLDSGSLTASLTGIAVGIISFDNTSRPDIQASSANYAASAGYAASADYAASAGEVTSLAFADETAVAASSTSIAYLTVGAVTTGDRIFVSASAPGVLLPQAAGTHGCAIQLSKDTAGSTASATFFNSRGSISNWKTSVAGNDIPNANEPTVSGIMKIMGDGTLVIRAREYHSSAGCSFGTTRVEVYACFLKKQ